MADKVRASPAKFAYIPEVGAAPPSRNELPALDDRAGNDIFPLKGITDIPANWLDEGILSKLHEILSLSQPRDSSPGTHSAAIRWLAPDGAPVETIFTVGVEHNKAGWSGKSDATTVHVKASFDQQMVLEVAVEHSQEERWSYDDSDCEWTTHYDRGYSYTTVVPLVTVNVARLVVGPSVVPFGLFLAACFHLADANALMNISQVTRVLNVSADEQVPGFASPKNWATVWERQDPVAALTDAVPFHRHINLQFCPYWGGLPQESLDTLKLRLSRATHASSASLNADTSEQLLALAAALPSSVSKVMLQQSAYSFPRPTSFGNWQDGADRRITDRVERQYIDRLREILQSHGGSRRTIK